MDELRELILIQLEELRGTGLSDERYQLYTDMVYQCETTDELLELAALEMQLEAHDFFMQLTEQMSDFEDNEFKAQEDLGYLNSDGFGDNFNDGFGEAVEEELDENNYVDLPMDGEVEAMDPSVLAMQQALLGLESEEDITDPSYFDIDALLVKGGSTPVQITLGSPVMYNDALADLLSTYPQDGSEGEELEFDEVPLFMYPPEPEAESEPPVFGQPQVQTSLGQTSDFGKPSGLGAPSGFGKIPPLPVGFGKPTKTPQLPQRQQAAPQPKTALNVFADFSRRKTTK